MFDISHLTDPQFALAECNNVGKHRIHFIFLIKSQLITVLDKNNERVIQLHRSHAYMHTCIRTYKHAHGKYSYIHILRIRRIVQRHQNKNCTTRIHICV